MNSADRVRLEESALQYAMALRNAMCQYRRSGKMQVLEHGYTTYTITRGPAAGPLANVHTAQQYDSGTSMIRQQYCHKKQWDIVNRVMFMETLETSVPERQRLLETATECSASDSEKATRFVSQILQRILQPSGNPSTRAQVTFPRFRPNG